MSDIDETHEPNSASMYGGLTGPVGARIEDAHFYSFREDDIPQNIVIEDVVELTFDEEDSVTVELKSGRKFNVVWNWAEADGD